MGEQDTPTIIGCAAFGVAIARNGDDEIYVAGESWLRPRGDRERSHQRPPGAEIVQVRGRPGGGSTRAGSGDRTRPRERLSWRVTVLGSRSLAEPLQQAPLDLPLREFGMLPAESLAHHLFTRPEEIEGEPEPASSRFEIGFHAVNFIATWRTDGRSHAPVP